MKRILIVDDAVTVRMFHKKLMHDMGFEVEEAENGVEALEKAISQKFDLFLVDVNMPKMDGYKFIETMRRTEGLQEAPVIMISTEESEQDKEKAYKAGANFYVVKPAQPQELKTYASLLVGEML